MAPTSRARRPDLMTGHGGFTIVELLMVIVLAGVLMGIAMVQTRAGLMSARASSAADQFKSKMNMGRERAISRQRVIALDFKSDGRLLFLQVNTATDKPQVDVARFEGGMKFMQVDRQGAVPTTVDSLCGTTNVLNGSTDLTFTSEGSLVDETMEPVSGCFYLGSDELGTMSRAISIFGPTGKMRTYHWQDTTGWIH